MSNILDFPTGLKYKVLFNLPTGKVLKINKGPDDDFDVTISGGHGEAVVPASGKTGATNKIQKVFPTCEIVEVEPIH
tara:strand:+ start:265 stop:495 length:231 start_codon:yes stop_codon:yes gene_type:complete